MSDAPLVETPFSTLEPEITLSLYQLLKDTHEIFTAHGLAYWIDAGTLLGAVRHGGLIPWDDDLDICIEDRDMGNWGVDLSDEEVAVNGQTALSRNDSGLLVYFP